MSNTRYLRNGLPQGSILSPTLFNLMLYDIVQEKMVKLSLYADDCICWKTGKDIEEIRGTMQRYLHNLNAWFLKWGFKISMTKTAKILFSYSKKNIDISLNGEVINDKEEIKFLGLIFDKKLTWRPHINDILERCKHKMNILKKLTGTKWGTNTKSLLIIYRALIRSLIDYGCQAYDSACQSLKNALNSIQYQCLKICTGALSGTSLQTLQAETCEMPLDLRRKLFCSRYKVKIEQTIDHPLNEIIQNCHNGSVENKLRKPFCYRLLDLVTIDKDIIQKRASLPTPPWHIMIPNVCTDLKERVDKKDDVHSIKFETLEYINRKWSRELHIYTDGSKNPHNGNASASFYIPSMDIIVKKRLQNFSSSYKAELVAIILALNWIEQFDNLYVGIVIFTDCLSALMAIRNWKEDVCVSEILMKLTILKHQRIHVFLEWIPGHCGVVGNEIVDLSAKQALGHTFIEIENKLNELEVNSILLLYVVNMWQERWNASSSALKKVKRNINIKYIDTWCSKNRKNEVLLHRIRMGCLGLNAHLYKIGLKLSGDCQFCNETETFEHFLVDCTKYIIERTMLLVELGIDETQDIYKMLEIFDTRFQVALINFIYRTRRFDD